MKKLLATLLSILISSSLAFAHSNHVHGPVDEKAVIELANKTVIKLADKGKIDKTWKDVKANKPFQKEFKKGKEWVVTFDNLKVKDKSKQKLYVFVSLEGKVLASNFSGN